MNNHPTAAPPPPTLDTCAQEPIHIPGSTQPHGVLLAFEQGRLVARSANSALVAGDDGTLAPHLAQDLPDDLALAREAPGVTYAQVVEHAGRPWSRIVHHHGGRDIIEFEQRLAEANTAPRTRLFTTLRNVLDVQRILADCANQIRAWTGFDRVMAYVFQPDGSGEVVAESRDDGIDSFLDMRFPATDIPEQARRLYVLNTLRLIPDIGYAPVPLLAPPGGSAVDLSYSVLRSVSPIHVEYLKNMGVHASMSVSIVVDGQLWGLFACHHRKPWHVAHEAREACDALAQFVSSRVQAVQSHTQAQRALEAAEVIPALVGEANDDEDLLRVVMRHAAALRSVLRCDALVCSWQGRVAETEGFPHALAVAIVTQLPPAGSVLTEFTSRAEWPEALQAEVGEWVGAMDIVFDAPVNGRLIALCREQISTVRWGGRPAKVMSVGPSGPRLTPRGSFAEWQETVRGRAAPWHEPTRIIARQLLAELARICLARYAQAQSARRQLLAMLGHDLRDPLHAIRMVASVLQRDEGSKAWANRIDNSSSRMQRLIAQVLDFSRAEAGLPILSGAKPFDLSELADDLVDESRIGHPGTAIDTDIQRPAPWTGDRERIGQAIANLLSNARHYGDPAQPIGLKLSVRGGQAEVAVRNTAPPLDPAIAANLADPFKHRAQGAANRTGLGLGLSIASRIARESGGELAYRYENGEVVFTLSLQAG